MGLNTISLLYPGLTPWTTDMPPLRGFVWGFFYRFASGPDGDRGKIYWICRKGSIYF